MDTTRQDKPLGSRSLRRLLPTLPLALRQACLALWSVPYSFAVFLTCLRWAMQLLLKTGPVPRHVAFIMDGNRRYADRQHVDKVTGHTQGYRKVRCDPQQPLVAGRFRDRVAHVCIFNFSQFIAIWRSGLLALFCRWWT